MKLSGFWTATTLCYVYGDITAERAGFTGKQYGLLAAAVSVAIPSVMVLLPLVLARRTNRWVSVVIGAAYTLITLVTLAGSWLYYVFSGVVEMGVDELDRLASVAMEARPSSRARIKPDRKQALLRC